MGNYLVNSSLPYSAIRFELSLFYTRNIKDLKLLEIYDNISYCLILFFTFKYGKIYSILLLF